MSKVIREGVTLGGVRYWTASVLSTLIGTTLPFWLHPPNFNFKLSAAVEFLLATILFHAGFSFLLGWFEEKHSEVWPQKQILIVAVFCIGIACLLGIHISINLQLRPQTFESIFLVYGCCALFVGALYTIPPMSFHHLVGGEIVLSYSLGLIPILGAYLVQVGDISRTVYLAALPVVGITGLWIWVQNMASYSKDQKSGRKTLVNYFGVRFSGRVGVPAIAILYILSIILAVFSASVNPSVLISLVLAIPIWKVVRTAWQHYAEEDQMNRVCKKAAVLHFWACVIIAVSAMLIRIPLPFPAISW